MEKRISTVILNEYQSAGIDKGDGSRQYTEKHAKLDESRRFSNKKTDESHELCSSLVLAEDYTRPTKQGENQCVSGVIGIAYNTFWDSEAGATFSKFEVAELLKILTEKIFDIVSTEGKKPSQVVLLEKMPECVAF